VLKLLSMIGAALVGAALATVTVLSVVSSTTAAPSTNPAAGQIIQYGDR